MLDLLNTLHEPEKIYPTGETPMLVTCENFQSWVCKHGRFSTLSLFNELIASRFAHIWEIKTPEICLINVLDEHVPRKEGLQPAFFKKPCFGSLYIEASKEIDFTSNVLFEKTAFKKKLQRREDFLKIALFDIWLSNEDRNHNNSNLLLDFTHQNQYHFAVIDHNSIFNSNSLKHGLCQISEDETIINTDLAKILFGGNRELNTIVDKIVEKFYICIRLCEERLEEILQEVPKEWNVDIKNLELLLHQNLFIEAWGKASERNFRSLIQTFL